MKIERKDAKMTDILQTKQSSPAVRNGRAAPLSSVSVSRQRYLNVFVYVSVPVFVNVISTSSFTFTFSFSSTSTLSLKRSVSHAARGTQRRDGRRDDAHDELQNRLPSFLFHNPLIFNSSYELCSL